LAAPSGSLGIRSWRELGLRPNPNRWADVGADLQSPPVPLFAFGIFILQLGVYSLRSSVPVMGLLERTLAALVVPFLESRSSAG
jgi:hypothetical protein